MSNMKTIPVSSIRQSKEMLRGVNKEKDKYKELVQSVRSAGILNPITVRDIGDGTYGIVNGFQRWNAAQDVGLTEIDVKVLDIAEADVLEAQIISNAQVIETTPVEYTKALIQMLRMNPTMTMGDLARRLGKSTTWLSDRFHLMSLKDEAQTLVDSGAIGLANAYSLAKVPPEHQDQFLVAAQTQPSQEFVPTVQAFVKNLRTQIREGKANNPNVFIPRNKLQKLADITAELEAPKVGPVLIANAGATTAQQGFELGLKWAIQADALSVDAAKKKWENDQKEHEELLAKRKKEREDKKKAEAEKNVSTLPGA